jgi:predicted MPP superfamily phosphohydrolase
MFLVIALAIYGLLNFYVMRRSWQALAGTGSIRVIVLIGLVFAALSFFAGRMILRRLPGFFSEALVITGNIYLAVMDFLFLFALLVDLLRLADAFFPFFPKFVRSNPQQARLATAGVVVGATVLILAGGAINALHPRLREFGADIRKAAGSIPSLEVVLLSDIHLSPLFGNARLKKTVDAVNRLNPDLVLMPGDIVGEDMPANQFDPMAATLRNIRAKYGVFACLGNHETYRGIGQSVAFIRRGGITVLQDEIILVADSFYIAGRKDRSSLRRGEVRKPLREILADADTRRPIILLDHQPLNLGEAQENGVDLELSGHTHGGQIFPLNLINKLIYEDDKGYYRKASTQYYVSSGVGTWGPPFRIGSVPEIVRIRLTFHPENVSSLHRALVRDNF